MPRHTITVSYKSELDNLRFKLLSLVKLGPVTFNTFANLLTDSVTIAYIGNYDPDLLKQLNSWWTSTEYCVANNKKQVIKKNCTIVVTIGEDGEPTSFLYNEKTRQSKKIGFLPFQMLNTPVIIDPVVEQIAVTQPTLYEVLVGLVNGFKWVHKKKGFINEISGDK